MKYLDMFVEDCKYYDPKNIEIKTILKHVNLKGKNILDIGAGIGRLSFPLARYAKEVIALDKNRRFREYFRKYKRKNVKFVNKKAEEYLKKCKKFDIVLLAWPTFEFKFIDLIKEVMDKNSIFIFITCDNKSDFESFIYKLRVDVGDYEKDIKNKIKFIKLLPKKFKLVSKKKLSTMYLYPNEKIAFRVLKNDLGLWFNVKLNKKQEKRLKGVIEKHKINGKIKFGEDIWFYLLKKR